MLNKSDMRARLIYKHAKKYLSKVEQITEKHKGDGHRARLRSRFLQGGLDAFLDYEIVELLLTLGTPRKDCKQMAKDAIKEFRGLRGVLDASLEELQEIKGIGPANAFGVKLFQNVSERYSREQIPEKVTLDSSETVAKFLQKSIGRQKKENFVMLSLDTRNNLVKISDISVGTLNASIVHPREISLIFTRLFRVELLDHIIVTQDKFSSLKEQGLI